MQKRIFLKVLEYYSILSLVIFSWSNSTKAKGLLYIYTMVLILVYLFIILKERINILKKIKDKPVPIIIVGLLIISSLISINPRATVQSSISIMIATFFILVISCLYDTNMFYSILSKYFITSIIFSIIYMVAIPSLGWMDYYGELLPQGVYSHKNVLARNMIIAMIVLFNCAKQKKDIIKRSIYFIFVAIAIGLVILSKSTTGLIYLIVFMSINLMIFKKKEVPKVIVKILYIIVIIFNICTYFISSPNLSSILSNINIMGKNLTFTGRNVIWHYCFEKAFQKPLFGYGFDVFWESSLITEEFYARFNFTPPHAHNGYLGVLIDGGIVILILIMYLIYKAIKNNVKIRNDINAKTTVIILAFILLINLTEAAFISNQTYLFWMIICFSYYADNTQIIKNDKQLNRRI